MILGERIRELRRERGMTQEELAGILYVNRTAVSGWENGKRLPDIFVLCNIADIFNVSLDYLVGRTKG